MIYDNNIQWKRKRIFLPVTQFLGLTPMLTVTKGAIASSTELGLSADASTATVNNNTIAATLALQNPVAIHSAGAGNPKLVEISTLGLMGLLMGAAGDDVRHVWMLPYDLDVTSSVGFRVWWASEAAAVEDRDIDWKVLYTALTPGMTALIAPATALDTVVPLADVPAGTANVIERSERGQIDASTLASTVTGLSLLVEMDAFDVSFTEAKYLLGLELDYALRKTFLAQSPDQSGNLNREYFGHRSDAQQYVADLGSTQTAI